MTPDLDRTRPVWRQVAAAITARIEDGSYPVGARVPSVVELSAEFGIAASTAQKALAHLKAEGLIRAEVGLGSFVADRSGTAAGGDSAPGA
ncbi:winged helix-turn-helix domain-containing protein [Streptomyces griseoloalbus]|uniref:Winged helix-turn-helix domain-containing protein n=1 Tax=Streptomyces griseoloalbus TaxID=67303 RepID=A0ABV3E3F1_9ACTN